MQTACAKQAMTGSNDILLPTYVLERTLRTTGNAIKVHHDQNEVPQPHHKVCDTRWQIFKKKLIHLSLEKIVFYTPPALLVIRNQLRRT